MSGRKYNWGLGGCAFLAAAVVLPLMTLITGGFVRNGRFYKIPPIFALAEFLIFGSLGMAALIVWFYQRRKKEAGKLEAKWRGYNRRPPGR